MTTGKPAQVTVVINVQFGDLDELLNDYLSGVAEDRKEVARNVLEDFLYWLLKRDLKGEA
jgi:hypothetical protein